MLILSVKASQVLVVPKNVGFSIPRYEPETQTLDSLGKKCRPGVGGWVAKITTTTIPYVNPETMVHVLLTLNEPLLQRSRPRSPLGLSLTTSRLGTFFLEKNSRYIGTRYEFSQPPRSYVETCTSFYVFSGPRWLTNRIGYWSPTRSHHRLTTSRR